MLSFVRKCHMRLGHAVLSQTRFVRRFQATRHKVVSLEDAAASVTNGDTIVTSGFGAHGVAEACLEALGARFMKTGEPNNLTLLYHAGPGDYGNRGLNHLGQKRPDGSLMIRRQVAAFFGQTPCLAQHALDNLVESYNFPMGSVSRMLRATASGSPGHITKVGTGTFVDPVLGTGGKVNEMTKARGRDLVERIRIGDTDYLFYHALPVHVAFIRGTTADPDGNITFEHESLVTDARMMANAARASGGVVVAQVKRLAESGTLHARNVHIPSIMVDCVVVVPPHLHFSHHAMSYFANHNPSWSQEVRAPLESIPNLPMGDRKVVARRAAQKLQTDQVVNLGIGMPEGVAAVANEESILKYLTLTTEAGAVGGVAAGGHDFGPASNPDAIQEMNQQFDFYNGGGLDICFLGAGEISQNGDVNVSRLSPTKLTGVGGFIDITQSTDQVVFMGTFTAGGLKIDFDDGKLVIVQEGKFRKFVKEVGEVTFSGDTAMHNGQSALYITERAVFKRLPDRPTIMMVEVAPGIDIETQILPHMGFEPIISPTLKTMDDCLFRPELMGLADLLMDPKIESRISYMPEKKTVFIDFRDLKIATMQDVETVKLALHNRLEAACTAAGGKVDAVVNYEGFDCREDVAEAYSEVVADAQERFYADVRRYSSKAFLRHKLSNRLQMMDFDHLWRVLDKDMNGFVSKRELKKGMKEVFNISLQADFIDRLEPPTPQGFPKAEFKSVYEKIVAADSGVKDLLDE